MFRVESSDQMLAHYHAIGELRGGTGSLLCYQSGQLLTLRFQQVEGDEMGRSVAFAVESRDANTSRLVESVSGGQVSHQLTLDLVGDVTLGHDADHLTRMNVQGSWNPWPHCHLFGVDLHDSLAGTEVGREQVLARYCGFL